jgi:hypothetical protein
MGGRVQRRDRQCTCDESNRLSWSILFLIYVCHCIGNENGKEAENLMSVSHDEMLF